MCVVVRVEFVRGGRKSRGGGRGGRGGFGVYCWVVLKVEYWKRVVLVVGGG